MKKAFDLEQADFSGIAGNKGELAVDGVVQKTYIKVNRDGVEAAAATRICKLKCLVDCRLNWLLQCLTYRYLDLLKFSTLITLSCSILKSMV